MRRALSLTLLLAALTLAYWLTLEFVKWGMTL